MDDWKRCLRGRLFGLDQRRVRAYLRKVEKLYEQDLLPLKQKVKEAKLEHSRLQAMRDDLLRKRQENIKNDSMESSSFVGEPQEISHQQIDVIQLKEEYERELASCKEEYERQIHTLEQQLHDYAGKFDTAFDSTAVPDFSVGEEDHEQEDTNDVPNKNRKIPGKVVFLKTKPIKQELSEQPAVTADGLALHQDSDGKQRAASLSSTLSLHGQSHRVSSYWGDIDGFLLGESSDGEAAAALEHSMSLWNKAELVSGAVKEREESIRQASVGEVGSHIDQDNHPSSGVKNSGAGEGADAQTAADSSVDKADKVPSQAMPPEQHASPRESAAIHDEIAAIRRRYIIGKLAGEDLYDHHGKLIAAKHAVISEEVVEKAERAGKLADLIVSMTIPGLGE